MMAFATFLVMLWTAIEWWRERQKRKRAELLLHQVLSERQASPWRLTSVPLPTTPQTSSSITERRDAPPITEQQVAVPWPASLPPPYWPPRGRRLR